jgi:uroporphyrinogen-III synthase
LPCGEGRDSGCGSLRAVSTLGNAGSRPRILVTRAAGQSSALAEALEALGLEAVVIPAIEMRPVDDFSEVDPALRELPRYDWLIFTSANAVVFFAARAAVLGLTLSDVERVRVAAIGAATARAVSAMGMPAALVPPSAVAESLAASLLPFARREDGGPARMMLVRAEEAREHLPEVLRAAGAEVRIVPVYRNVVPQGSIEPVRNIFVEAGKQLVQAITFTSSSSVRNLLALCEAAGAGLPGDVLRISIGPVTSATLREAGLPPHAEAEEASVAALADAVAKAVLEER